MSEMQVPMQPAVAASDLSLSSEGLDPTPSAMVADSFDASGATQSQPHGFSTEAPLPTCEPSPEEVFHHFDPQAPVSEGDPGASGPTGPTRAVLQCFAGQAHFASDLIKQGCCSYGEDGVKHKSAMAPVLQMDLSSRTACDSVLTWLDQQKVAGVMMCIPKHGAEPLMHYGIHLCRYCRLHGKRSAPPTLFILAGLGAAPSNTTTAPPGGTRAAPMDGTRTGRSLIMSNMPEIVTVRRDALSPLLAPRLKPPLLQGTRRLSPLLWLRYSFQA